MMSHRDRLSALFALLLPLILLTSVPVRADVIAVQGQADSTATWAAQARSGFQAQSADTVREQSAKPFDKVGLIARALLARLPGRDLLRAREIQATLDSLGMQTEVTVDPASPGFALVMVRNPWRLTSEAVGYLFWYRLSDLRVQGTVFRGGYRPNMRVWWSGGRTGAPYKWGIVDESRGGIMGLTVLRVSPDGTEWEVLQSEQDRPTLSEPGTAQWTDLNRDGVPELVSWTIHPTDSLFTECSDCPRLYTERTFNEGVYGFELMDERMVPTPYATFVYFVRLLIDGRTREAERLVRDPARVKEAIAAGWNTRSSKSPWMLAQGEPGQAWPRRLGFRFRGPGGAKSYDVVFGLVDKRWVIEDWFEPRVPGGRYPSVSVPAKKPAARPAAPATRRTTPAAAPKRK